MGTGSTTGGALFNGSNALWVIGSFGPRPPTPDFVAWPPPGFVPYRVVFARWSFSRQSADFSTATVTMTKDGASIALTVLPIATGFGDNTIGWEPRGVLVGKGMPDATYHASLSGVRVNGKPQSFAYDVTIIDPASSTGTTTTSTGTATTGSATTTSTQTTSTTTTSSTTSTCTKGTKGKREPAAAKKRKC